MNQRIIQYKEGVDPSRQKKQPVPRLRMNKASASVTLVKSPEQLSPVSQHESKKKEQKSQRKTERKEPQEKKDAFAHYFGLKDMQPSTPKLV
jgi:hypothetical protein